MANLFQSVRGFNDVLPTDTAIWQYLHNTAADVFAAYGYGEIKLPLLEHTELNVSVQNLTDRYYLDPLVQSFMPAPGRTWRVGMVARF